jgi:Rrf2 family protein
MTGKPLTRMDYFVTMLIDLINKGQLVHISKRGDYGIRAVLDLAQHYGQGLVQSSEIASRQLIPEPYLDQLLVALRKAGLVRSVRGPKGGHMLARSPNQVTLEEVLVALEGPIIMDCGEKPSGCVQSDTCAVRRVWQGIDEVTKRVLSSTTMADLVQREQRAVARPMYYI